MHPLKTVLTVVMLSFLACSLPAQADGVVWFSELKNGDVLVWEVTEALESDYLNVSDTLKLRLDSDLPTDLTTWAISGWNRTVFINDVNDSSGRWIFTRNLVLPLEANELGIDGFEEATKLDNSSWNEEIYEVWRTYDLTTGICTKYEAKTRSTQGTVVSHWVLEGGDKGSVGKGGSSPGLLMPLSVLALTTGALVVSRKRR